MSTRFRIRLARPPDLDAVRSVVGEAYAKYVPRIGSDPAPMFADYEALMAAGAVTVALYDDAVVGVLVLIRQPDALLIENVAVAPRAQHRGIGLALLAVGEQRAQELGLAKVTLYTNVHMTENLTLYPALGYREVGRRSEHGFDRVYFEKVVGER